MTLYFSCEFLSFKACPLHDGGDITQCQTLNLPSTNVQLSTSRVMVLY